MTKPARDVSTLTPDQIREALDGLQALVDRRLPERFYAKEQLWRKALTGLIARIAGIATSIGQLADHQHAPDALTLLRSLYEHIVLFAWLAISPEERVPRWYEETNKQRLKLQDDARDNLGLPIYEDEELQAAGEQRGIPERVAERAAEADGYWADRVAGLHVHGSEARFHILSLRGLYTVVYRLGSRTAHGALESVDYCGTVEGTRLIVHRQRATDLVWPALAVPLFAMALVIASERLGWPDSEAARKLNDEFVRVEQLQDPDGSEQSPSSL